MSALDKLQQEGRAEVVEALLGKGFSQTKLNELLPIEFFYKMQG
jgi:hypothetical protein